MESETSMVIHTSTPDDVWGVIREDAVRLIDEDATADDLILLAKHISHIYVSRLSEQKSGTRELLRVHDNVRFVELFIGHLADEIATKFPDQQKRFERAFGGDPRYLSDWRDAFLTLKAANPPEPVDFGDPFA